MSLKIYLQFFLNIWFNVRLKMIKNYCVRLFLYLFVEKGLTLLIAGVVAMYVCSLIDTT
jgi:hypothetical protein